MWEKYVNECMYKTKEGLRCVCVRKLNGMMMITEDNNLLYKIISLWQHTSAILRDCI